MSGDQLLGSVIEATSWAKISTMSLPSFMDLTTILVFTVVLLVLLFVMATPATTIPGPYAWPLIGNLFQFIRMGTKRHVKILSLREKYGDIFRMYIGPYLVVFVCGYENIQDAFVKHAAQFSNRPNWLPDIRNRFATGGPGLVWSNGERWKKIRRFALQSMRDFGVGKKSLEEVIQDEAKTLSDTFTAKENEAISDVKRMMTKSISNVIHHVVFGFRYSHDDEKFQSLVESLDLIFKGPGPIVASLPGICQIGLGSRSRDRVKAQKLLLEYTKHQIAEHEKTFDENNLRDFVDLYIQSCKEDGEKNTQANHLFRIIIELFAAGTETTGTSLDWAFLYMIIHPEIQQKCFEEIKQVVGADREVRFSDKPHLPYVEATLQEVLRIGNIASSSVPHTATENVQIAGQLIPKDAIVMAVLPSSHLDASNFSQPYQFRPERFIDDTTGKVCRDDHLIPFSMGPRICPGESLAKTEMFLVFSNLIQKFQFSKVSEGDVFDLEGFTGITTYASPYRLKVKLR
uniref:Cytochrome P450 2B4-like n=1 Tax=Crassostrea virginica TaxID=6565 RepID=A0A8B8EA44_CRAVI|nr:cytochrome P450 2B4-like [Crassostrea virginica]